MIYSKRRQLCKARGIVHFCKSRLSIFNGMIVAIALMFTILSVSAADSCTPDRLLVPGGIATHDGSVGFFTDIDSGIVALRLFDGKQLWKTDSATLPAGVIDKSLIALSKDLKVHIFDENGHETFISESLDDQQGLRDGARLVLQQDAFNQTNAEACCCKQALVLRLTMSWNYIANGPAPHHGSASKTFAIDRSTGKVNLAAPGETISEPNSDKSVSSEYAKLALIPFLKDHVLEIPVSGSFKVLGKHVICLTQEKESLEGTQFPVTPHTLTPNLVNPPDRVSVRPPLKIHRFLKIIDGHSGKQLWSFEIQSRMVPGMQGPFPGV